MNTKLLTTQLVDKCDNLFCGILRVAGYAPTLYNKINQTNQTMTASYQTQLTDTTYNGWTNYETWNVGLWLGNDEGLYEVARRALDFDHLIEMLNSYGSEFTGDGVRWDDPSVNRVEIEEMLEEM